MRSLNALRATVLGAALALGSAASMAALVTITNTSPDWSNVVGGGGTINEGWNGAYYDVRWGTPAGLSGQSGLGFNPTNPPAGNYNTDVAFQLGELRHYNNPIFNAASQVDLSLTTTVSGAIPAVQTFAFRFLIDETPNVAPCAYPSTTPCADRITFQNLDLNSTFSLGGVAYTFELLGFGSNAGSLQSFFISNEGGTNTTGLWARITSPSRVPEPASLALVGMALTVAGVATRRRQKSA